jgi:hypothetical protein
LLAIPRCTPQAQPQAAIITWAYCDTRIDLVVPKNPK